MNEREAANAVAPQMDELRRQAEQRLRSQKVRPVEGMTEAEARALVHELQVHQIELEMLKAAKDAAEQANRAKDRFLAVLSHELRTPLTPVVMGLSMLQDRLDLDPPLREMLEMVRRNVEFEARLIDNLLEHLADRAGQGRIDPQCRRLEHGHPAGNRGLQSGHPGTRTALGRGNGSGRAVLGRG